MKNKRVLFLAPSFFGYELEIKKQLENLGAVVDFYDDRPSNTTFVKTMIRIAPNITKKLTSKYFSNIIKENKNKNYDYIFFIKCEAASNEDLMKLKMRFTKATFILYLYDSLSNLKYFDKKQKYFDFIYSFDPKDVKANKKMQFLPLFYLDIYKQHEPLNQRIKYDLSFIGTAHSDRPKIVNQLRKKLNNENRRYYFQLYVQSKIILLFKKMTSKDFRELCKYNHITLNKLSADEVQEIMRDSRCILDVQHPNQSGLTMRTIELVGMRKKFITTNESIKTYDFYNSKNIILIDRNHPVFNFELLGNESENIPQNIYESYSLDSWIIKLFSLIKEEKHV